VDLDASQVAHKTMTPMFCPNAARQATSLARRHPVSAQHETARATRRWLVRNAALLLLAFGACGQESSEPPREDAAAHGREVLDFTLVETHEGVKRLVLVGSHMREDSDRHLMELEDIRADFFGDNGEHQSVLTARTGTVETETGDMVARSGVVVVTDDGVRLETEELRWCKDEGRIVTDLPVRILREGGEVRGVGLETDPHLRHFRLGREIEGEWRQPVARSQDPPQGRIDRDGMSSDIDNREVTAGEAVGADPQVD
jgi:LPS export ABC transporter protein LptC